MGKLQFEARETVSRLTESDLLEMLLSFCRIADHHILADVIECIDTLSPLETIRRLKELDPRYELSPYEFMLRQFPICLLKKYPFKGNVNARRVSALQTFMAGEDICRKVNDLLEGNLPEENLPLHKSLDHAQLICRNILGRLDVERVFDLCRLGPGLNLGLADSRRTGAEVKFGSKITLTPNLIPIAGALLNQFSSWDRASLQGWSCNRFEVAEGNKIAFVPKDAFTERTIAIEPLLNSFIQRGIGLLLRLKLRSVGIDLVHGQEVNSAFAREGSLNGSYATIDISNASGCISYLLVKRLLPETWFNLLDTFRSSVCRFPEWVSKKPHTYEQFSSMGNGYTFELETLLFYSLVRTIVPKERKVLVYGDDIIIPSEYYTPVIALLGSVGFAANPKKSFTGDHPFRESCGKDYLRGTLVRPLFITKEVSDVPSLVELANRVRQFATESVLSPGLGESSRLFSASWSSILDRIPRTLRSKISTPPYYPGGLWKGGINGVWDTSGNASPYYGIVKSAVQEDILGDDALLAARLYGVVGGQKTTLRESYTWDVKLIPGYNAPLDRLTWGGWT